MNAKLLNVLLIPSLFMIVVLSCGAPPSADTEKSDNTTTIEAKPPEPKKDLRASTGGGGGGNCGDLINQIGDERPSFTFAKGFRDSAHLCFYGLPINFNEPVIHKMLVTLRDPDNNIFDRRIALYEGDNGVSIVDDFTGNNIGEYFTTDTIAALQIDLYWPAGLTEGAWNVEVLTREGSFEWEFDYISSQRISAIKSPPSPFEERSSSSGYVSFGSGDEVIIAGTGFDVVEDLLIAVYYTPEVGVGMSLELIYWEYVTTNTYGFQTSIQIDKTYYSGTYYVFAITDPNVYEVDEEVHMQPTGDSNIGPYTTFHTP